MGSATIIAIVETSIVPMTSGSTPKRLLAKSGVHSVPKRKSPIGTSRKKPTVSIAEDDDDADRREDRQRGAHEQRALDDPLDRPASHALTCRYQAATVVPWRAAVRW